MSCDNGQQNSWCKAELACAVFSVQILMQHKLCYYICNASLHSQAPVIKTTQAITVIYHKILCNLSALTNWWLSDDRDSKIERNFLGESCHHNSSVMGTHKNKSTWYSTYIVLSLDSTEKTNVRQVNKMHTEVALTAWDMFTGRNEGSTKCTLK